MGRMIANNMYAANIEKVIVVGGSQDTADALNCSFVADSFPGEGPLGGLVTAIRSVSTEILCVLPCDVPRVTPYRIQQLVTAVAGFRLNDASVLTASREHWLCSSWRVSSCLPVLEKCFADGERAIHRAVNSLTIRRVLVTDEEMININTLQDAHSIGPITEIGD
jgi:molybdopterin-guanine dinucleotide biosynthesis protein A